MSKHVLLLLSLGLLSALSVPASALAVIEDDPPSLVSIFWEGVCLDCLDGPSVSAGGGMATGNPSTAKAVFGVAQLGNAGNGITDLANGNLLTFSYTSDYVGTLSSYHVNATGFTFGTIGPDIGSFALSQVEVFFRLDDSLDNFYLFSTGQDGDWTLSRAHQPMGLVIENVNVEICENCATEDFGIVGVFNGPAPASAPATLALLGLGLAGLGWSRRAHSAQASNA